MWFVAIFGVVMWALLRVIKRKQVAYALGFGLAPAVASLTGASLPISISGLLPSPWGLIPNMVLWLALGWLFGMVAKWVDGGIPEAYLGTALWGVILALNSYVGYRVAILMGLIWAVSIAFSIYQTYKRQQEEYYQYISADKAESAMVKSIARGIVLVLVFSAFANMLTAPGICGAKGLVQCDILTALVVSGATAWVVSWAKSLKRA